MVQSNTNLEIIDEKQLDEEGMHLDHTQDKPKSSRRPSLRRDTCVF